MILIPFFVFCINEIAKFLIQSYKQGFLDPRWLLHSGGMPSGHSAFTSSIAVVVAYAKGYDSAEFLMAFGFALVTMYDARGVRKTVGIHAKKINTLTKNAELEEYVGHTNWEVLVGCSLGVLTSIIFLNMGWYPTFN